MKRFKKYLNKFPIIGYTLFSLLTLSLSLGYADMLRRNVVEKIAMNVPADILFCMGTAQLFRAFCYRHESRLFFCKFIGCGVALLLASIFIVISGKNTLTRILLCTVYPSTLLVDRVISCFRNHKIHNILLNIIAIYLILSIPVTLFSSHTRDQFIFDDFVFIEMLVIAGQALISIMSVVFARINLHILKSVVRETHAAEIVIGLLLLIVSFSYVLQFMEPSTPTFSEAIWYCFAIVTTIGFGDVIAKTVIGRVLSVILGIYGIIVVALITSIIVNVYSEKKKSNQR